MDRRLSFRRRASAVAAVCVALALSANAATFNVVNLSDGPVAAAGDLPGSLRQAIFDANHAAGADVITFQTALTGTITLTNGVLTIFDSVDVQGPGPATITVSGNNSSGVFDIDGPPAGLDVSISGLTITGGRSGFGGASNRSKRTSQSRMPSSAGIMRLWAAEVFRPSETDRS